MTGIEDARAVAQDALEFYRTHPDSPAGYLASALETLLAEHERLNVVLAHRTAQLDRLSTPPTVDEREALRSALFTWWDSLSESSEVVADPLLDVIFSTLRRQGPIIDAPLTETQLWNALVEFSEAHRAMWGRSPNETERARFLLGTFDVRSKPVVEAAERAR